MTAEIVRLADRAPSAEGAAWRSPAAPMGSPLRFPARAPVAVRHDTPILPLAAAPSKAVDRVARAEAGADLRPFPFSFDVVLGLAAFLTGAGLVGGLLCCLVLLWRATQP